jgi:HTH-type transcriptional regulator/antitoxin HigA
VSERDEFRPDWTSPPGDTIADILEERDVSVQEFASKIGRTFKDVQELLHGRVMITLDTARKIERAIGGSAEFWMLRETQYRRDLDRVGAEQHRHELDWLKEIPVRDMTKFGWLEARLSPNDRLEACLQFFGVPNVQTWREIYGGLLATTAYKTSPSFDQEPGAVGAWLRRSEIEGESIECKPWSPERFEEALLAIRGLTRKKDPKVFIPELIKRCTACGVAVVVVRAPKGCRASGDSFRQVRPS